MLFAPLNTTGLLIVAAVREIKEQSVDLIVAAASRLVQSSLDDERHKKLVRGYLDDLKAIPPPK